MSITINSDVISSKAGQRAVLARQEGLESLILNPVGTLLWERLSEGSSTITGRADLVEYLSEKFPDVPSGQATKDVDAFLHKLINHKLISLEGDAL